jgi:hypothetical protein
MTTKRPLNPDLPVDYVILYWRTGRWMLCVGDRPAMASAQAGIEIETARNAIHFIPRQVTVFASVLEHRGYDPFIALRERSRPCRSRVHPVVRSATLCHQPGILTMNGDSYRLKQIRRAASGRRGRGGETKPGHCRRGRSVRGIPSRSSHLAQQPSQSSRPLARYGAIEGALRERPPPSTNWPGFTLPQGLDSDRR